jgi:hypothetical protein
MTDHKTIRREREREDLRAGSDGAFALRTVA